jgi:hypothetical protein
VPEAQPVIGSRRFVGRRAVSQVGSGAVPDEEQVSQRLHPAALLAVAEQGRDGHAEILAEQVQQRGFHRGDGMHGDPQVEGLGTAATGVAAGELAADITEHGVVIPDAAAFDQRAGLLQRVLDGGPARHFPHSGVAFGILENQQVPGEVRSVGAAEVEQHAVMSGDGDHPHLGDGGCPVGTLVGTHEFTFSANGRRTRLTLSPVAHNASMRPASRSAVNRATGTETLIASWTGRL